jgi:hypothetical protein
MIFPNFMKQRVLLENFIKAVTVTAVIAVASAILLFTSTTAKADTWNYQKSGNGSCVQQQTCRLINLWSTMWPGRTEYYQAGISQFYDTRTGESVWAFCIDPFYKLGYNDTYTDSAGWQIPPTISRILTHDWPAGPSGFPGLDWSYDASVVQVAIWHEAANAVGQAIVPDNSVEPYLGIYTGQWLNDYNAIVADADQYRGADFSDHLSMANNPSGLSFYWPNTHGVATSVTDTIDGVNAPIQVTWRVTPNSPGEAVKLNCDPAIQACAYWDAGYGGTYSVTGGPVAGWYINQPPTGGSYSLTVSADVYSNAPGYRLAINAPCQTDPGQLCQHFATSVLAGGPAYSVYVGTITKTYTFFGTQVPILNTVFTATDTNTGQKVSAGGPIIGAKPGDNIHYTVSYCDPTFAPVNSTKFALPANSNGMQYMSHSNISHSSGSQPYAYESGVTGGYNAATGNIEFNLGNVVMTDYGGPNCGATWPSVSFNAAVPKSNYQGGLSFLATTNNTVTSSSIAKQTSGDISVQASGYLPIGDPTRPVANGPCATSPGSASITVSWVAPTPTKPGSPAYQYIVQWIDPVTLIQMKNSDGTPKQDIVPAANSSITYNGLSSGQNYLWKVQAQNYQGPASPGRYTNFGTPYSVGLCLPGLIVIPAQEKCPNGAHLTWQRPQTPGGLTITSYTIIASREIKNAAGQIVAGKWTVPGDPNGILLPDGTPLSFDTPAGDSLFNETQYTFTIYATNANGNGVTSVPSNVITDTCTS